jgi:cytochrome c oxidase assembly protein subunit 15
MKVECYQSLFDKRFKSIPDLMKSLYIILGLLCVQLCLGMTNVIFKLPLVTAISHTVVAVLILLAMITFIFKLAFIYHEERV